MLTFTFSIPERNLDGDPADYRAFADDIRAFAEAVDDYIARLSEECAYHRYERSMLDVCDGILSFIEDQADGLEDEDAPSRSEADEHRFTKREYGVGR